MSNPTGAPATYQFSLDYRPGKPVRFACVDIDDMARVLPYRWTAYNNGRGAITYARAVIDGKKVRLHRWLLGLGSGTPNGPEVLHRDNNGLNCTRANLCVVTHVEQAQKLSAHALGRSGYRGVSAFGNRWRAAVTTSGHRHLLGIYDTPEQAAAVAQAFRAAHLPFSREAVSA